MFRTYLTLSAPDWAPPCECYPFCPHLVLTIFTDCHSLITGCIFTVFTGCRSSLYVFTVSPGRWTS